MILVSSLGRAFWTAWNADSMSGEAGCERTYRASGILIGKEETTHFGHLRDFRKGPWVR